MCNNHLILRLSLSLSLLIFTCVPIHRQNNADRIQPWPHNPKYWQYKGAPVLLVGGTKDDNLFQLPDLEQHLDSLAQIGGNYIRNTMSSRVNRGWEIYRFKQLENGQYDLAQWNDDYWTRFQNMLQWTYERDIIVQIEVWDRFDYSRDEWLTCPWNPENNINYSFEETGFAPEYPKHPSSDLQPFFHSIPGMDKYDTKYDIFRLYQEKFVDKLLSYSLDFPNVLYCMNNETSTSSKWGQYWMKYIRDQAQKKSVTVYVTDMFDDFWQGEESDNVELVFSAPELYAFVDISQVNSRNFGQQHWDRLRWLHDQVKDFPRPLNNTKIYGGNETPWGSGTNKDGIERMWRHVIGGSASMRHHRPPTGCGLNAHAIASIKAIRKMETLVKMWDLEPHMELLANREDNEAYVAAKPGTAYAVYFPETGTVDLDMRHVEDDTVKLFWINISTGEWGDTSLVNFQEKIRLQTPSNESWVAIVLRKGVDNENH
ncbi:hypothetical protein EH223_05450 [candidate division KSB1 bacterium]|nr:hypothetical protein [candidate division KSB1 bacterium]RQW05208.1 MAG: hypothetical protein EH223_05450 [candidate division KSB1 bacterium]